eukprot:10186500-Lingulodinium_polyedra.AAC.1
MAIEIEPLGYVRVYICGEDNVLGDALSRAPGDRAMARNLPVPLLPIKELVWKMFWAPDALAGDTKKRVQQLGIENLGVLAFLPDAITEGIAVNEALPEDELPEAARALEPAMALNEVRAELV